MSRLRIALLILATLVLLIVLLVDLIGSLWEARNVQEIISPRVVEPVWGIL